ncbi:hypothetical protein CAS74_000015 [Pichia kudriavzevii]|uniref:RNA helicase n=1 Tax=Pichia kudriavzevii TaxID=4909 RepID=A0A1Z8JST0_PICKU|nr:hypothetical protein CAS74_000015 [Pichia kudriavzevii]
MFKKRGNFKKGNSKISSKDEGGLEDDILSSTPILSIKRGKEHCVEFKKKQKLENTQDLTAKPDDDAEESYFEQFDDYENIDTTGVNDIFVHRLTPPFLDSHSVLTTRQNIAEIVRDKSGDLYKLSKNGSTILNEKRRLNEISKGREMDTKGKTLQLEKVSESLEMEDEEGETAILQDTEHLSAKSFNRESLPAYKVRDQLMNLINENQVLIVIGETGSGKTTQLPQFLYEKGYTKNGMIGITQPRRMAAVSVAGRVGEEMGVAIGTKVGFTIRFNDKTSSDTQIKFMTDGILLRETLHDPLLSKYSCVIMDEAHERSLNTDILFGIIKKVLMKRRDFKLIITSATMNSLKFSRFFNNAPQFQIPGKTFPVDIMFQSIPSADYIDSAVKQALKIHLSNPHAKGEHGDILVFMTGQEDMSESENRKCIVATNIAETSLTLHHVKFVIDSGLMKLKVYNPKLNMDALQMVPISKAQAKQRSGRAGRVCPGQCFRLYTLTSYEEEMWDEPIPEIQRNLGKFPFVDSPSKEALETSQYDLWTIGALNNFGELTELGKKITRYPIDPMLSKMLIISKEYSCSAEILRIVSMLSVPPVFNTPKRDSNLTQKATQARENFQIEGSDHLTLLNIFNQFENARNKEKWCTKNFLNFKSLRQAYEIHSQLKQLTGDIRSNNNWNAIRECICASYFPNAAEFFKHGQYKHCRLGLEMYIHPTSVFFGLGDVPRFVVFHELVMTSQKQQIHYLTSVEADWLKTKRLKNRSIST